MIKERTFFDATCRFTRHAISTGMVPIELLPQSGKLTRELLYKHVGNVEFRA